MSPSNEFRLGPNGRGTGLERRKRLRDLTGGGDGDMDVVGLKDPAQVGLVRLALAQALDCRLLVAEGLKEGEGETRRHRRLARRAPKWLPRSQPRSCEPAPYIRSKFLVFVGINSTVRSIVSAIHLSIRSPYPAVAVRTNSVLRLVPSTQSADRAMADIIRPRNVR